MQAESLKAPAKYWNLIYTDCAFRGKLNIFEVNRFKFLRFELFSPYCVFSCNQYIYVCFCSKKLTVLKQIIYFKINFNNLKINFNLTHIVIDLTWFCTNWALIHNQLICYAFKTSNCIWLSIFLYNMDNNNNILYLIRTIYIWFNHRIQIIWHQNALFCELNKCYSQDTNK